MTFRALLTAISQFALDSSSMAEFQEEIVNAIAQFMETYHWVGFYMIDPADPQMLQLVAFVGEPTPHVRIPLALGICGAAASTGKTVVVDDVSKDSQYLRCSIATRSEIVVPIQAFGRVIGEIDVDSHFPAAFGHEDRAFLEETARIVGKFAELHANDRETKHG